MSALFLCTKDKRINILKLNNKYTKESADPKALINERERYTNECADPVKALNNKRNAVHNLIDPAVFPPFGGPRLSATSLCCRTRKGYIL